MSSLKKHLDRLRRPLPRRGWERKSFLATIFCLVTGFVLSFFTSDWSWMQRFGALIVVVGIWAAWKDISRTMDEVERIVLDDIQKKLDSVSASRPVGLLAQDAMKEERDALEKLLNSHSEEFKEYFSLYRVRAKTYEAILLAFGTIVWGFGDILGVLF